jgi:hypothetical protein
LSTRNRSGYLLDFFEPRKRPDQSIYSQQSLYFIGKHLSGCHRQ